MDSFACRKCKTVYTEESGAYEGFICENCQGYTIWDRIKRFFITHCKECDGTNVSRWFGCRDCLWKKYHESKIEIEAQEKEKRIAEIAEGILRANKVISEQNESGVKYI